MNKKMLSDEIRRANKGYWELERAVKEAGDFALRAILVAMIVGFTVLGVLKCAHASPFLVCDPPAEGGTVEWYEIEGSHLPAETKHPTPLHVDMAGTPAADYTVRARACNVWGCSEWSDSLDFTRPAAWSGAPGRPGLVGE